MKNSTNKILTIAVILLLIANIALVAMMVMGKQRRGHKRPGAKADPIEMMSREVGMTDQQKKDYQQLKEEHFQAMRPLMDSVRAAKTAFFELAKTDDTNESVIDSMSRRITERQAAADKLTLAHFRKVRNLFTPDQQPKFDEFVKKMMQQRMNGRKKSGEKK
jgi:periplasmic protein CpxP/Spy